MEGTTTSLESDEALLRPIQKTTWKFWLFSAVLIAIWAAALAIAVSALARIGLAAVRALSSGGGVAALPRVLDAAAGDVETTLMFDGSSR